MISRDKKTHLFPNKSDIGRPHVLHASYRKKEAQRIAEENDLLAKRLLNQQSRLNMKKFDEEYERHKALTSHICKLSPTPKFHGKLPPIEGQPNLSKNQSPNGKNGTKIERPKKKKRENQENNPNGNNEAEVNPQSEKKDTEGNTTQEKRSENASPSKEQESKSKLGPDENEVKDPEEEV